MSQSSQHFINSNFIFFFIKSNLITYNMNNQAWLKTQLNTHTYNENEIKIKCKAPPCLGENGDSELLFVSLPFC